MSDPDRSEHWDAVAENLGVEQPGAPTELPAAAVPAGSPVRKRQRTDAPPGRERAPTDWGNLAQDLGIAQPAAIETPLSEALPMPLEPPSEVCRPEERAPTVAWEEPAAGVAEETVAAAAVTEDEIDFGDSDPGAPEDVDRQGRRRRRRRPRRRLSRKRTTESQEGTTAAEDPAEEPAEDPAEEPAEEHAADVPSADSSSSLAEPEELDGESVERPIRSSHRNIPTWEEAIGVIVDANTEARATRTKAGRVGRPRGRGRKR